jgi:hypothetical protein
MAGEASAFRYSRTETTCLIVVTPRNRSASDENQMPQEWEDNHVLNCKNVDPNSSIFS